MSDDRSELSVASYTVEVRTITWVMQDRGIPDNAYKEMVRLLKERFPEATIDFRVMRQFGDRTRRIEAAVAVRTIRRSHLGAPLIGVDDYGTVEATLSQTIREAYTPRFAEIVAAYRKGAQDG